MIAVAAVAVARCAVVAVPGVVTQSNLDAKAANFPAAADGAALVVVAAAGVHLGNHEGLDGWLLAATALGLRRALPAMRPTALRPVLAAYLAVMLTYGALVAFGDGWNEQAVKRGWGAWQPPGVLTPSVGAGWAILLALAAVLYLTAFRVTPPPSPAAAPAT